MVLSVWIHFALALPLASLHNTLMLCAGTAISRNANESVDHLVDDILALGQLADDIREEFRELQNQMTGYIKQLKAEARRLKLD